MIQDYWEMTNEMLETLARKYHIAYMTVIARDGGVALTEDGEVAEEAFFDRSRVITELVARDAARQGNWSLTLSIISLVGSFVAIIISVVK